MHVALVKAARRIRHLPYIAGWERLWDALRPAFHRIASIGGDGIPFSVGGQTVRVPAEFASNDWGDYEPEVARIIVQWARRSPGGLFLDIGSSIGLFSAVVMLAGQNIECIAFDSDLASLAAVKRLCRNVHGKLRLVHGYVADSGGGRRIPFAELSGDIPVDTAPAFRNLVATDCDTPRNALDDLFRDYPALGRSILLKSDIEGAELMMLQGARDFIARHRPTLLLSVHHGHLPLYGHSADDVRNLVGRWGYSIELLAVDHEEHWLCCPLSPGQAQTTS